MAAVPDWERIQKKTFTKWINTHMNREYGESGKISDIISDWQTGINLMKLTVALYKENDKHPEQAVSMPKLKEKELNPKSRIQEITNLNTAINLLKQAGVNMRGVSAENLCDHQDRDKAVILGMIFTIILDYGARGFGGSSAEVKRALLEWVNKKTEGYERVNPPGVKNFTKDWSNGLAWCALIHRHRPNLIDYQACLGQSNADNLETAFAAAEGLGIPRLLDVEDMDVALPDEKSVLTYTMEYFLRFASDGLKEGAAKQAADWLKFLRQIHERENEYERRARAVLAWIKASQDNWDGYNFGNTQEEAIAAFNALRAFVTGEKPEQEGEKMDLEALFAEIQTTLKVNNLSPYVPPADVEPSAIDSAFVGLVAAQNAHGTKVRENRFKFVEKKEDKTGEELAEQINSSFRRYDSNGNGTLNKAEFNAACMELGVALKTDQEKDALFEQVSGGADSVSHDNYAKWMKSRLVVSLDDPESIKNAFKVIADGSSGLSEEQLSFEGLSEADVAFMKNNMKKNENGLYDYAGFVSAMMA